MKCQIFSCNSDGQMLCNELIKTVQGVQWRIINCIITVLPDDMFNNSRILEQIWKVSLKKQGKEHFHNIIINFLCRISLWSLCHLSISLSHTTIHTTQTFCSAVVFPLCCTGFRKKIPTRFDVRPVKDWLDILRNLKQMNVLAQLISQCLWQGHV